jgi:hypothetical protein
MSGLLDRRGFIGTRRPGKIEQSISRNLALSVRGDVQATLTHRLKGSTGAANLSAATRSSPPRNARASGHERDTAVTPGRGFRRRPPSSLALIQRRSQTFESLAYRSLRACALHALEYE